MFSFMVPLFLVLLLLGIPIFLTMGITAGLVFGLESSLVPLAQKIIDELNSPTLLAVPYFVIAATFMERGGVAKALINAAVAWIGRMHGGLGLVSVLTCAIFAAMCGSSVATAIAMGTIMIPAMLRAGYAPHHFQRMFRDITGVTPRSYAEGVRGRRLAAALAEGARVAEAVAGAGFGSESRVYENSTKHLGMTPGAARRGGAGEEIRITEAESPFGPLLIGATSGGICFLGFGEPAEALRGDLAARFPAARLMAAPEALAETLRRVIAFIEEPRAALDLPLDLRGTIFQRRVWAALRHIPPGETRSYSALAAEMGAPRATRAVARACAQNPVSLAVPCHRVVGKDGDITGYRWGVTRKRDLLLRESR